MSETDRVRLCSTFWQRSDDGVWISDGGRDTADPDEFQAALALIDRLARELREAEDACYRAWRWRWRRLVPLAHPLAPKEASDAK